MNKNMNFVQFIQERGPRRGPIYWNLELNKIKILFNSGGERGTPPKASPLSRPLGVPVVR